MFKVKRTSNLLTIGQKCVNYSTTTKLPQPVPILPDSTLSTFRSRAYQPEVPALLPRGHFSSSLPAVQKWFSPSSAVTQTEIVSSSSTLNITYLSSYGDAIVPVEITDNGRFAQVHQPLQFFLDASNTTPASARVYLAQASLADLPATLREDVPTPELILKAGKGDIYDTSIWLGRAPTYTPLHRDPNPNLFVQLAGRKRVRLFKPALGGAIFHHVQTRVGGSASATMRGTEMMEGVEREVLEEVVWRDDEGNVWPSHGFECEVGAGDGLFIPKGWWHSIKGVGEGITGSVNWWFR